MELVSRSRNLIPFPYATNTANANIIKTSYDGKITVNGTSTVDSKNLYDITTGLEAGKTYTLSGCPGGGDYGATYCLYVAIIKEDGTTQFKYDEGLGVTFTLPEYTKVRIFLYLKSGYTATYLVFKPMLNEGDTALPYEPYVKVDNLTTRSRNLIPFPYKNSSGGFYYGGKISLIDGITYQFHHDGTIVANGENSRTDEASYLRISYPIYLPAGATVGISGCPVDSSIATVYFYGRNAEGQALGKYTIRVSNNETKFFTVPEDGSFSYTTMYIQIRVGAKLNNVVFKPMLYIGDTVLPFEPYIQNHDLRIIQNLINADAMVGGALVKNDDNSYTITRTTKTGTASRFSLSADCYLPVGKYLLAVDILDTTSTYKYGALLTDTEHNYNVGLTVANSKKVITIRKTTTKMRLYIDRNDPVGTYTTFKNLRLYRLA